MSDDAFDSLAYALEAFQKKWGADTQERRAAAYADLRRRYQFEGTPGEHPDWVQPNAACAEPPLEARKGADGVWEVEP